MKGRRDLRLRLLRDGGHPIITVSAKFRLTLWLTLMVLLLAALVIAYVLLVNHTAALDDPEQRLVHEVAQNAARVEFDNGRFDWEDLETCRRGVYCAYYDREGALLLAALPEGVDPWALPFQGNVIRTVRLGGEDYYLYDQYVDMAVAGLWIRGLVSTTDDSGLMHTITVLTVTLLPILLILAMGGGWFIAWDTFRPMERILSMANSISDGDDLTARIDLKRGSSEMLRLSQAFDRMFERLERSFNAERQFASDASHELRTPITVILAACDRARRKAQTPADYSEALSTVEEQAHHMSELVQQLLGLTRMQHGTDRYPMREADLSSFVASCCEEFVPRQARSITLTTEIRPGVRARYNPALFSRVVQNLLQNAYAYGREGGQIRVSLSEEGGLAVLRVADDGIGIAPEDLEKVWQRFWQADASHSDEGSSGLGLAMVREIAEFHGGRAAVESRPGEGSVFTVTI